MTKITPKIPIKNNDFLIYEYEITNYDNELGLKKGNEVDSERSPKEQILTISGTNEFVNSSILLEII